MAKYSVRIELTKLNKVGVTELVGKTGEKKKCLVIPIEDNPSIYIGKKGTYLNLSAIETPTSSFGQSHILKPSIPTEIFRAMTDEAKKSIPIVGSLTPISAKTQQEGVAQDEYQPAPSAAPQPSAAAATDEDDLPF